MYDFFWRYACQAWLACVACMVYAHMWRICVASVHRVSTIRAWLAYVWSVREGRARMCMCSIIIFNFNPASKLKSACTACSHTHTKHTYTHTGTHAKNLFSRTFCTSPEYGDYGYPKIKGMANTQSAISQLQIYEIEKI